MLVYNKKQTILLDFDDVLAPCLSIALQMHQEMYGYGPMEDYIRWGDFGTREVTRQMMQIFDMPELYKRQDRLLPGAAEFVDELLKRRFDVYIVTAATQAASHRFEQVTRLLPQIDPSNIILTKDKSKLKADFALDDSIKNIRAYERVTYPILFRTSITRDVTGALAVNGYDEAKDFIFRQSGLRESVDPQIVCFVGPSGSNKQELIDELVLKRYGRRVMPYTNNPFADLEHYNVLDEREFSLKLSCLAEHTHYGGYEYGLDLSKMQLSGTGRRYLIATDICGALSLQSRYPGKVLTVHVSRSDEAMVQDILEKKISEGDRIKRILSLQDEKKNARHCMLHLDTDDLYEAAETLKNILDEGIVF